MCEGPSGTDPSVPGVVVGGLCRWKDRWSLGGEVHPQPFLAHSRGREALWRLWCQYQAVMKTSRGD